MLRKVLMIALLAVGFFAFSTPNRPDDPLPCPECPTGGFVQTS